MHSRLIAAALVLLGVGCAPNPGPVYLSNFIPLSDECTIDTGGSTFLSGGTLDVAPGSPHFIIGLEFAGADQVVSSAVAAGGTQMESGNRDRPVLNELVLTYSASPTIAGLPKKEFKIPRYINFTGGKATTFMDLISPEASVALDSFDGSKPTNLIVTLEARGFMSGSGATFTTGPNPFPIRLVRSDPATTCPSGNFEKMSTTCKYNGQGPHTFNPVLVCCAGTNPATGCP